MLKIRFQETSIMHLWFLKHIICFMSSLGKHFKLTVIGLRCFYTFIWFETTSTLTQFFTQSCYGFCKIRNLHRMLTWHPTYRTKNLQIAWTSYSINFSHKQVNGWGVLIAIPKLRLEQSGSKQPNSNCMHQYMPEAMGAAWGNSDKNQS